MKNYTLFLIGFFSILFFNINAQQTVLISQGGSVPVTNGDLFYDAGGAAGTDGNVSKTITLTPAVVGQAICIDFTTFKSGGKLEIFDGATVAATNIGTLTQDFTKKYDAGTGAGQDAFGPLAAELKPGIFCSNNASGTLTLKYTASGGGQPGWAGNIITHPISTGCSITLTGNPLTICNGSSTTLTASGTVGSPLLSNDFNTSSIGTGWNSTPGGVSFLNVLSCQPNNGFNTHNTDNSVFAWMQSVAAPRTLETNGFDVSLGGYISFDFRMAADDNGGNGCESPDNREGVYVQYSKDNGVTWTTMKLMFPAFPGGVTVMGCGDYVFNWGTTSLPIPAGAFSASTKFRWYQNSSTSSTEDSWGLDNVKIYAYKTITLTLSKNPTSAIADGTVLGSQNTSPYSLSVSPTTTTTYRARISDGVTSCYQDITITVNPCGCTPPTITTQPLPVTICAASNTSFTVAATGGNGQYQWQVNTGGGFTNVTDGGVYSGATSATLSITGAPASMNTYQYQCIVKEAAGTCPTTSSAVALTVNSIPTLTITNPAAACSPATVDITAPAVTAGSTGGTTLSYWSNNLATLSIANQAAIPTSGTYYIKSTLNGCFDIKPVVVTINTPPTLTITNPATVCSPSTVDITAPAVTAGSTGGTTLSYWSNNLATLSIANQAAIPTSGTYYIKSTLNGCSDIKPVVVTVNTPPTLTITNPAAVCSPLTVDITTPAVTAGSTGGTTLSYWSNNLATLSIANQAAIPISGTYYIKSTLNGCSDIKPVVVTINTTPVLSIHDPAAVCSPLKVDITTAPVTAGSTGAGTLSYWTNLAGTTSLATPSAIGTTGIYYIKSTLGSCTDIKPVNVTVNTTPVLSIHSPAAVCSPLTVDITAGAVTLGSTGAGIITYWTNLAGTITLASPSAIGTSGTYYIKSTLGSCSDIQPVVVTINTTPVLSIHDPAAVCSPSTVDITAGAVTLGSTGAGTLSYWTNAGASSTLAAPSTIAVTGTYYIKSTLGTCTDIKPVNVTINTTPALSIHNPNAVCSPSTVDITLPAVTLGSTGAGTLSYWTNAGASTSLVSPSTVSTSGTYYIKSTLGSCSDIKPVIVTINTTPSLTISDPTAVCSPATIDITVTAVTAGSTGGGILSYWNDLACSITLVTSNAITTSGTYYIKSTLGSCTDIKPVTVVINNCGCPLAIVTNAPVAVCSPSTVNLTQAAVTAGSTGGGALTYWTDAACTSPLASPSAVTTSGTYYIKGSNGVCFDSKPVLVTVNTTPSLSIHDPAAVCSPLTVDFTNPAVTAGSTGAGTLSYWTNIGATIALANPNSVAITGTYYIKSTLGTCTDIKAVNSIINTSPSLTITNPAAVCSPATIDLTASNVTLGSSGAGILSYWQDLATISSLTPANAVATSGTYYIKSTLGTCTDVKSVTVTINTTPVLAITNPAAVCAPLKIDLSAPAVTNGSTGGGILSYWIDAAATQTLVSSTAVPSSGTYYIKSTIGLCTDIKPVTVTIDATPVLSIHNPSAVCIPGTVDITTPAVTLGSTGGGILSYWNDAGATSSLATPSAISVANTYYIKSLLGNCFDIEPVIVTISAAPVLSITNPNAVCLPSTIDITLAAVTNGSTGAGTLSYWTDAATTISHVSPTASNSGTYYIKSTVGSCVDVKPVIVTVITTPSLTITNPNPACPPTTIDLTVANITAGSTGGGTLTYWSNALGTVALPNSTAINQTGVYYIKSANGNCFDIKPVNVVLDVPTLTITDPLAVCSPTTVNITAATITNGSSGYTSLTYFSDNLCTFALPSPATINASGTYYIKASNSTCSVSKAVNVVVNQKPVLSIHNPTGVCSPATIDITAPAISAGSTGGGVLTYWTDVNATINLNGPSILSTTGTYYIKSTSNGCVDIKPVVVTINNTPSLLISNPPAVCAPSTVDLTQLGIINGSTNLGAQTYFTDQACLLPVVTPKAITTSNVYYIKSLAGVCFDIKPVIVTINPQPMVVVGATASGCEPLKVDITDPALTTGSTPGATFDYWTDAAAKTTLSKPNSVTNGTYYITNTLLGCTSNPVAVNVVIHPLPIANFSPSPSKMSTINPECLFTNESLGGSTYFWDFGDGEFSQVLNPRHVYPSLDTASFYVSLVTISQFGCSDTIVKKVELFEELVYFVPNTFTPDEDQYNNTFQPVFVSGYDPYNFSMYIFNRWGEIVFESHDAKIGWKGTYGTTTTELAKEGVYTWKISFNLKSDDRKTEITGHVNLVK